MDNPGQIGAAPAAAGSSGTPLPPEPLRSPKKRPFAGSVWQWFWRSDEMRSSSRPLDPERAELLRRARLAAEVARRTSQSSEPFEGSVDPLLCNLYRQSIHWSLSALMSAAGAEGGEQTGAAVEQSRWGAVDRAALLRATGGDPDLLARVMNAADTLTFEGFAALPPEECSRLLGPLRAIAASLVAELEIGKRIVEALWLQRVLRVGLLLVLLVVGFAFAAKVREGSEQRRDLAIGKPWRTSSWYLGCHSPDQECTDSPEFFFHTQEETAPWVELDLGSKQRFSAVRIENRKDCCTDRAAPIVIEVSNDQQKWKTVARHDAVFTSWLAELAPTDARWVRVRLEKRTVFHLARVRVLR